MGENGHTCVCMAEFLHCSPETTTTLIDYTPVQKKSSKKKKERLRKCVLPTATQLDHFPRSFMPRPPTPPQFIVVPLCSCGNRQRAGGPGSAVHTHLLLPQPCFPQSCTHAGFPCSTLLLISVASLLHLLLISVSAAGPSPDSPSCEVLLRPLPPSKGQRRGDTIEFPPWSGSSLLRPSVFPFQSFLPSYRHPSHLRALWPSLSLSGETKTRRNRVGEQLPSGLHSGKVSAGCRKQKMTE